MGNEKLVEATIRALRGKLEESTDNMLDANSITKFISDNVKNFIETMDDYGNIEYEDVNRYDLDDDLSIYVGYTGGYDKNGNDDYIHLKSDPSHILAVQLSEYGEDITNLDYLTVACNARNDNCYETQIPINKNGDYSNIVKQLISDYKKIRRGLDNDRIIFESNSVDKF